ncbi:hypothetical protein Scep_029205 [Stephania cephalantha]|uniref:Dehydrogenase/reductase SDR family member 7 n=1 Tax=Stephania cephalantha TaxID=152367 RepID=A0AAP0E4V0_9MAGN
MLALAITLLTVAAILTFLFKFATADGDFTLISRGKARREEIEDKVFWITGASRGIGEGFDSSFYDLLLCFTAALREVLAKQLASLGAKLILSARSEKELERVKAQLAGKHAPDGVKILPLDLASGEESLKEAVDRAESFFPGSGVDYMVHNAAYERPKASALDSTEGNLKATFDVNVLGTISLTRLLAPSMLKRGKGHFVVLYRKGIKVTVVCPGPIDTSNSSGASTPEMKRGISSERCAELTLIAATHGLKEAWISDQPVLAIMYLVQYMPTVGYWIMDKVGANRVEAAAQKGNTYSWKLLFGHKKTT